jgi:hypothetical protein
MSRPSTYLEQPEERFRSEKQALSGQKLRWDRVTAELRTIATSRKPVPVEALPEDLGPLVRKLYIESSGVLGFFTDDLRSALSRGDGRAVAREVLKIKHDTVDVAHNIRVSGQRRAAENRRAKRNNALARIEGWERENSRPLTPQSHQRWIAACAKKICRAESTVKNWLYKRARR